MPAAALALGPHLVPAAGSWERSVDAARFTPRFAAVPGTEYAVVGRDDRDDDWTVLARFVVPAVALASRTVVERIDPGGGDVPANLLRFSVTFSAPIEEGSAAGRIRLLDVRGAELPGTLFAMPPELWDRDRRRLTVLLEPGRIKRGLQPNVQAGPPLRDGEVVTLVVDAGVRDDRGAPLVREALRSYRVGAAVRSRVDPTTWEVRWPETAQDPLVVRFDRPLNRALVARHVRAADETGRPVPGHASLDDEARVWSFGPAAACETVAALHVDARLEDLAGNSVRRVFDRDLRSPDDDGIDAPEVVIRRERPATPSAVSP